MALESLWEKVKLNCLKIISNFRRSFFYCMKFCSIIGRNFLILKTMEKGRRLVKIADVARALGVNEETIRSWVRRGVIKAIQIRPGLHRRFDLSEVERLKKEFGI
jgi:excisionase family DNA binding protein